MRIRAFVLVSLGGTAAILVGGVTGLVAFGTVRPGPAREGVGVNTGLERVDYGDLPPVEYVVVRDGTRIAWRAYPAAQGKVVLLVHGSSSRGRSLHALARRLSRVGAATAYAIDVRGHGESGPRGDIRYIGQLEDDLADVIAEIRKRHAGARLVVTGFSAGGGLAVRFAAGPYGDRADAYLFLAPWLHQDSPTTQPGFGGWATPYVPRIIGLAILNRVGVTAFNHLPVLAFNLSEEDKRRLTPTYSWNLAMNFRTGRDYRAAFALLRRPAVLIVGRNDEELRADAYAADVGVRAPAMPIVVLEGVNHMGLIVDGRALDAIADAIRRLP